MIIGVDGYRMGTRLLDYRRACSRCEYRS